MTDRRVKALPAAIEAFNKIQGTKLPSWNTDMKLNLYKNPGTPEKEWIMEARKQSSKGPNRGHEVKDALHKYLGGELDKDARSRIEAEEKIFGETDLSDVALLDQERLMAGYLVKDP